MKVEAWDPAKHWPLMSSWCSARGLPEPYRYDQFPSTGLVVNGTHLGFVYVTNCSVCVLDQFLSDPGCAPEQRSAAMRALCDGLAEIAKANGATIVWMATSAESILKAGEQVGFVRDEKPFGFSCRRL